MLDFGSWDTHFETRVPMGYKVIQVAERLALVDHGLVVRDWPRTEMHPGATTYAALDGEGPRRGPEGRWVTHEHNSYEQAVDEARGMREQRVLVVRLLTTRNWH